MMFKRKPRSIKKQTYDKSKMTPTIKASICTGEQVAGLKDKKTGRFEEIMVIRTKQDLEEFMELYDITPEEIKKEW